MANAYYYTVASLPSLQLDQAPPFERSYFLQLCENTLSPKDYKAVRDTTFAVPDDENVLQGVAADYWRWERSLRNALVKVRAKELKVDGTVFIRDEEVLSRVEEIAQHAVRQETPLKAEEYLAQQRCNCMDEHRRVDRTFGVENIQIWYLQFQLLERMALFQREKGFQRYKELYQDILENHGNSSEQNEVNQ